MNSAGTKGRKVLGSFAQADELDRHFQLVDDRNQHAALRRRVEFRDDDARQLGRCVEELGLRDRVLTVRAVDDEQRLGRRLARSRARSPAASS